MVPLVSLTVAFSYIYYLKRTGLYWAPIVTYSLIGALLLVCSYDLLRAVLSRQQRRQLWLYEHIYKMTSSYIAIVSAFTGTVLVNYQPYSQFVPGILGWLYIIGSIIYYKVNRGVVKFA